MPESRYKVTHKSVKRTVRLSLIQMNVLGDCNPDKQGYFYVMYPYFVTVFLGYVDGILLSTFVRVNKLRCFSINKPSINRHKITKMKHVKVGGLVASRRSKNCHFLLIPFLNRCLHLHNFLINWQKKKWASINFW